ncbi:MAG: STT3 domain-containing protein, partial [Nanoarchaeota archaeon]
MKKEIEKLREKAKHIISFLKQRKVQIIIIGILILAIIIWSSWIRLQNLPLLKDSTTDKYMPLALDPFYFLRLAQTTIEQGSLPEIDMMRAPAAQIGFTKGLTTSAVVLIYRLGNLFSDISIEFADVIYPVIFFALGLIVFFFWIKSMTNSKTIALISSGFLAIIPSYIYRTLAGFSDHEAIGMFAFFSTMLIFTIGLKFLNKKDEEKDKNYLIKLILLGILLGFLSSITLASWGGISKFVFLIIPLSFGFFWIFEFKDTNQKDKKMFCFVLFYFIWILGTIFTGTFFGYNLIGMIKRIIFTGTSIFNGLLCIFLLTEFSILKLKNKFKFLEKRYIKKYRILVSIIISIVLGLLLFFIIEKNSLELLTNLFNKFLHPFGNTRTGLTVSENQQPYLKTWISQTGPIFFWLFFGGLCILSIKISENVKKRKDKILFIFSWILLILGILFSRINAQHIFNGINLISKV